MATRKAPNQRGKTHKTGPAFAARAKQTPDGDSWITIGLAWPYQSERGGSGYSVRLHTIPTNWDGAFLLMPLSRQDGN
jgi:hypothetical protein